MKKPVKESAAAVFLREYAPQSLTHQDAVREGRALADDVRHDQAVERRQKASMSDAERSYEKAMGREIDMQRIPDDRGEAPVGRQDPSKVVTFRCASCESHNRLNERDLAKAGYVRDAERAREAYERMGLDEPDEDDLDGNDDADTDDEED